MIKENCLYSDYGKQCFSEGIVIKNPQQEYADRLFEYFIEHGSEHPCPHMELIK